MSLRKRMLLTGLMIAIAVAFTPVLGLAGLGGGDAYATSKLKAPKSVKAEAVSADAVKVTWKAVKGARGYTVYQQKNGKFKAVKNVKAKVKKATIAGLESGDYSFQVKAFKKKGKKKTYGKASKKVTATLLAPVEGQTAACSNGQFVGSKDDKGVLSFKGIPYAKPPTGKLRWQAPQAPAASNAVKPAQEFGNISVQANYPLPDPAQNTVSWVFDGSKYQVSEDCLTLNVWTKDLNPAEKKPVMVWFHGGGFVVGSTTNDAYQLDNFANAQDMVMVSCNYRLGLFGSADLSAFPEGKTYKHKNFKQSQNLALLDDIRALEWIQENIEAFGGDPDNVTIFGNSAGAADITILTAVNNEKIQKGELFKRVIAQSGSLSLCVPAEGAFKTERTGEVAALKDRLAMLGVKARTLDDLMAVPEETMIQAYTLYPTNKGRMVDVDFYDPTGEEFITGAALCYDNVYTPVYGDDAGLLPKDPYDLVKEGQGKNIDVMYGSNQNEWNYWIWEMAEFDPPADPAKDPNPVPLIDEDYNTYVFGMMNSEKMPELQATLTEAEKADYLKPYMELPRVAGLENKDAPTRTDADWTALAGKFLPDYDPQNVLTMETKCSILKDAEENVWRNTEFENDLVFRAPAAKAAADHAAAGGSGKTYMYYWAKETGQKYQKAGHASEISYVTGNTNHTCFSGTVDTALSSQIQTMWANFARTGDPSTNDVKWVQYDSANRATMTIDLNDDMKFKTVNKLYDDQRELVEPLLKYHLK